MQQLQSFPGRPTIEYQNGIFALSAVGKDAKLIVFQQLKPICSQLLQLKHDAKLLGEKLRILHRILKEADRDGLQACKDYVLFPLSILLDAIVAHRGGQLIRSSQMFSFLAMT